MSLLRLKSIKIKNYRSFGEEQIFVFPNADYKKPVSIVGYNNSGKTNLMNSILYGTGQLFVSENTFTKNDLHNLDTSNLISIISDLEASNYTGKNWRGENFISTLNSFSTETQLKDSAFYQYKDEDESILDFEEDKREKKSSNTRGMITTNWKLLKNAISGQIHFNIPKIESVLDYPSNDKNSLKIWNKLQTITEFGVDFFPPSLETFLELDSLTIQETEALNTVEPIQEI